MSEEQLAAQRVLEREARSDQTVNEEEGARKRQQILNVYNLGICDDSMGKDIGTGSAVLWNPSFEFKSALMINSRVLNSPPAQFNLYYNRVSLPNLGFFDHFYCYDSFPLSTAKLETSLTPEHLFINAMNSMALDTGDRYRQGSMFIQLAVEHSLNKGRGGKVELTSARQSGQFYFKLGFLPKNKTILERLSNGEEIDGGEMYLPEASITAWKKKIAHRPILHAKPHENFLAPHIQFFTAAVDPYIRQVREVITTCCGRRKQP